MVQLYKYFYTAKTLEAAKHLETGNKVHGLETWQFFHFKQHNALEKTLNRTWKEVAKKL